MDWDDLRVFIAAARGGTLSSAGQKLGVDTATVGRRVARLEAALKSTLLVRSASGLRLTAAGAQLLEIACDVETSMDAVQRVAQPDLIAGTVRISAAEGFGAEVLAPALPALADQRPNLRIELAAQTGFLSPSRREVDMAITLSPPPESRLIVEPLATYELSLYASQGYLSDKGAPQTTEALEDHRIVGYVDDLIYTPELRYLDEVRQGLRPHLASSSIRAQKEIIAGGGGIGVLPCFMAVGLHRVLPQLTIERRFWLSTHTDVHATARMREVRRWLCALVDDKRQLLAPNAAPTR